jgi:hypothetical protein
MEFVIFCPISVGFLVFLVYYFAYQRGYRHGYRKATEMAVLIDYGAAMERKQREFDKLLWEGTGEEGGFEGLSHDE